MANHLSRYRKYLKEILLIYKSANNRLIGELFNKLRKKQVRKLLAFLFFNYNFFS